MRNRVRCTKCDEIIESKHRHDWVACKGGHIFIDGGHDYQRYGALTEDGMQYFEWLDEPKGGQRGKG